MFYLLASLSATNQPLRGVALPLPAIMLLLGTLDVDLLRGSFWSAVKGKELLFFGVYSLSCPLSAVKESFVLILGITCTTRIARAEALFTSPPTYQ